jgi:hypothetical protein
MPPTPRFQNRVSSETTKRLLSNLENLSVPSFEEPASPTKRLKPLTLPLESTSSVSQPMLDAALQRMRNGIALQRLRVERDAAERDAPVVTDAEEAVDEGYTQPLLGGEDTVTKQPLGSVVALGHKVKRRNSGAALSA